MKQIVSNMMFRLATKGRYKTDPYGGIEIIVCCRGSALCLPEGCRAMLRVMAKDW